MAEVTGKAGFDSVTIDLQHGLNDYQAALAMLQALAASDSTPMARVPWLEPGIIMKLLDAGALGNHLPHGQHRRRRGAAGFTTPTTPPVGSRSFGPTRAVLVHGADYFAQANDTVITLAMVETAEALENVEAIAQTHGAEPASTSAPATSPFDGPHPKLDPDVARGGRGGRDGFSARARTQAYAAASTAWPRRTRSGCVDTGFDLVTLASDLRIYSAACASAICPRREDERRRACCRPPHGRPGPRRCIGDETPRRRNLRTRRLRRRGGPAASHGG